MRINLKKFILIMSVTLLSTPCFAKFTKVYFVCDDNKRVFLVLSAASTERITAIQINKEEFKICEEEGDLLTFKKNICSVKSSEVKFNLSTKELIINQQPKPAVLQCR
jgi:hypothetical protein